MGAYLSAYWGRDGMRDKEEMNVMILIEESFEKRRPIFLPNNEFQSLTVLQLKEKIHTLTGFPVDQQRLIFGLCLLEDDALLVSYGINSWSIIHTVLNLQGSVSGEMDVEVFVKELSGRITSIHLPDNDFQSVTVLQLKEKIHSLTEYPVGSMPLTFNGEELDGDSTLSEYGIQHMSVIGLDAYYARAILQSRRVDSDSDSGKGGRSVSMDRLADL